MYRLSNKVHCRKAAGGYGIALLVILMIMTLITTVSIQMMLSGATLPGMQNAIRNNTVAQSVAESAFPAIHNQIQTLLNSGTDVPVGYSFPVGYITTPNDPSNLAGANTQIGSYAASVTKKGGDYYLISITATVNGVQTTEVRALTVKPVKKNVRIWGRNAGEALTSGDSGQGYMAQSVGDVDGDGIQDVVVGSIGAGGVGETYVIFGRSSFLWNNLTDASGNFNLDNINGVNTGDNNTVRITGKAGGVLGSSIAATGDVDGDGYDDILMGNCCIDDGGVDSGEAYIVFGRPRTGTGSWNALTDASGSFSLNSINGVNTGDNNTIRLRTTLQYDYLNVGQVGDLDGDKIDDVIAVAPGGDDGGHDSGTTYIFFGRSKSSWNSITDASGNLSVNAANGVTVASGDNNGIRLAGRRADRWGMNPVAAGDVDGDGYNDLLIGGQTQDAWGNVNLGEIILLFGRPRTGANSWESIVNAAGTFSLNSYNTSAGICIMGWAAGDKFGYTLSPAGDVNKDGYDDFIVSAPWADRGPGVDSGEVYLFFGRSRTTGTKPWNSITYSPTQWDIYASGVANGVDAAASDGNIIRFTGRLAGDVLVWTTSGDFDGDGYTDLLLCSSSADGGGTDRGEAYIVFGRSLSAWNAITTAAGEVNLSGINGVRSGDNSMIRITGRANSDIAGYSLSAADFNGDGYTDILMGATGGDAGGSGSGEAYIIWGRTRTAWDTFAAGSDTTSLLTVFP